MVQTVVRVPHSQGPRNSDQTIGVYVPAISR